jgi:hypothetical protein
MRWSVEPSMVPEPCFREPIPHTTTFPELRECCCVVVVPALRQTRAVNLNLLAGVESQRPQTPAQGAGRWVQQSLL